MKLWWWPTEVSLCSLLLAVPRPLGGPKARVMRRGASYMDKRQQCHPQQGSQAGQTPGEQWESSGPNMGHRSSIAGWRQFSTEKLIGIKQKVADWNPLGSGRSKSFLGFSHGTCLDIKGHWYSLQSWTHVVKLTKHSFCAQFEANWYFRSIFMAWKMRQTEDPCYGVLQ